MKRASPPPPLLLPHELEQVVNASIAVATSLRKNHQVEDAEDLLNLALKLTESTSNYLPLCGQFNRTLIIPSILFEISMEFAAAKHITYAESMFPRCIKMKGSGNLDLGGRRYNSFLLSSYLQTYRSFLLGAGGRQNGDREIDEIDEKLESLKNLI
eukprot:TRINITY_DN8400_c0_g1_i1.p1 TRINITY_DN8400_c0_g1~~TRINITY_DN8400_c0_g1_i1.p1  ORF type:complete len:156 (+),score=47.07 TRINITY_DN8400_c0_g1_i1:111-578(+)